jgi:hypothetical protein
MKKATIMITLLLLISSFGSITAIGARPTTIIEPNTHNIDGIVDVEPSGTSNPPIIKCKWEFAVEGQFGMDADPTVNKTQVDPPMEYDGYTPVDVFVIIRDPDNSDEAMNGWVEIDFYHPINNGADNLMEPGDGSFKDNLILSLIPSADALAILDAIETNDLEDIIWFNAPYTLTEIKEELMNGDAYCFNATYYMYYHQPAGWYKVEATAFDVHGTPSTPFINYFEYTLGVGIEIDFDAVNWDIVHVCTPKWFHGNWVFDPTEIPQEPTVRNIGNWDVEIWLNFSAMGFGKSSDGQTETWDVEFDARIGDTVGHRTNNSYEEEYGMPIYPEEEVRLPIDNFEELNSLFRNHSLLICHTAKISFLIHVLKATEGYAYAYGGPITIIPKVPAYIPDDMPP